MDFRELKACDRTLLPILVNASSRAEFMSACTKSKENIFKVLMPLITDESLKLHKTKVLVCQRIAVRLQRTMEKMFQVPHNLFTRADFKMLVAWGVHNAYVNGYSTKDCRLLTRDWTDEMEAGLDEVVRDVVKDMYTMATENKMLSN